MLDARQIQDHLSTLQYRPNVTWEVIEDQWEGVKVRFLVEVEDTYGSGDTTTLGIDSYLSPNDRASTETLDLWFAWRVYRIESHEVREFLKRSGQPVFDPHATA